MFVINLIALHKQVFLKNCILSTYIKNKNVKTPFISNLSKSFRKEFTIENKIFKAIMVMQKNEHELIIKAMSEEELTFIIDRKTDTISMIRRQERKAC